MTKWKPLKMPENGNLGKCQKWKPWKMQKMEKWKNEKMEKWKNGKMDFSQCFHFHGFPFFNHVSIFQRFPFFNKKIETNQKMECFYFLLCFHFFNKKWKPKPGAQKWTFGSTGYIYIYIYIFILKLDFNGSVNY